MTENEYLQAILERLDKIINALSLHDTSTRTAPESCPKLYAYLEEWLTEVKAPKIKPKSLAVLRSGINLYIKPVIANKPLNAVRTPEMLKAIEKCPHSYMRQVVYSIFRAVFKRAYQYDLIEDNPAEKLDFVYHKRQKGKALTNEEQAEFIAAIQGDYMRPLWLFYLLSGVRCQEALTLLWTDIDEKRGRIFIRGTKTENAERYIPLFPQIAELLKEMPRTGERVFPYTYRAVQCSFYRIRAASGLKFRIHDLRHTFATRCLESGIATKTVAKWLGHKRTATTDEIYSHLLTDFERAEMAKFNPKITTE